MKNLFVLLALILTTFGAKADDNNDGAYLDPAYENLVHPEVNDAHMYKSGLTRNNVEAVIANMTPVRSQGSRGTCSIFSAAAILEGMLVIKKGFTTDVDLSEEFLEYMAVKGRTSDGSNSYSNFSKIAQYGMPYEATLPYVTSSWVKSPFMPQAQSRCGHLTGTQKESCLLVHFDPNLRNLLDPSNQSYNTEFVTAYNEAAQLKRDFFPNLRVDWWSTQVRGTTQIKQMLRAGLPLTMGHDFYYGAYNHRKATEYGIGRDNVNWNKGIIGYPERGSMDRKVSPQHRAGHSVLVVGYDDDRVVTTRVLMEDGTYKEFSYKGVYYFKNSWGAASFGAGMEIDGVTYPGYGIMTQKYAHEFGSFYRLPIN